MAAINFPASPNNGDVFGTFTYDSSLPGWRKTPELAAGLPAGTIVQWPGATAPANWLLCQGQAVSRTTYASLFAAIGVQFGVGDGITTFNLPDLRGRVAVGFDTTQTEFNVLGGTGGAKTHTLTAAEIPSHTHTGTTASSGAHTHDIAQKYRDGSDAHTHGSANGKMAQAGASAGWTDTSGAPAAALSAGAHTHTFTTDAAGSGGAHNNLQPYITLNYIIKISAGITSGDSELATRVGTAELEIDALQLANSTTNKSGLVPIIPSSVTVGAGTASVDSTGKITFTNSRIISPNAVFSATYTNYLVQINITAASADSGLIVQFRNGTTVNTSATYRYTYTEWVDASANPTSGGNLVNSIRFGRFATGGGMGELAFYSPYDSGNGTRILGKTFDTAYYGQGGGWNQTAERHDSFCLHNHASITITGTMRIFGVVN